LKYLSQYNSLFFDPLCISREAEWPTSRGRGEISSTVVRVASRRSCYPIFSRARAAINDASRRPDAAAAAAVDRVIRYAACGRIVAELSVTATRATDENRDTSADTRFH